MAVGRVNIGGGGLVPGEIDVFDDLGLAYAPEYCIDQASSSFTSSAIGENYAVYCSKIYDISVNKPINKASITGAAVDRYCMNDSYLIRVPNVIEPTIEVYSVPDGVLLESYKQLFYCKSPLMDGNDYYFIRRQSQYDAGILYKYTVGNTTNKWNFSLQSFYTSFPAEEQQVYATSDAVYCVQRYGDPNVYVHKINKDTGAKIIRSERFTNAMSAKIGYVDEANDALYLLHSYAGGYVTRLKLSDLSIVWTIKLTINSSVPVSAVPCEAGLAVRANVSSQSFVSVLDVLYGSELINYFSEGYIVDTTLNYSMSKRKFLHVKNANNSYSVYLGFLKL